MHITVSDAVSGVWYPRVGGVSVTVKEIVQRAHIQASARSETTRHDSPPFGDGACQKVGPKGENKVEDDGSDWV
jgi:hypothetical protein